MSVTAGRARPSLLLHGHPRTHATWHRVAPLLAGEHTVVCPDLRGYGGSSKPPTTEDHEPYSKRAMARDVRRPDAAPRPRALRGRRPRPGHLRGPAHGARPPGRGHPPLPCSTACPIGEALARCNARFAQAWWHWFFLAQPRLPERGHRRRPGPAGTRSAATTTGPAWARRRARTTSAAIHDPATVHAMCEDYRAGLGLDRAADDADRAAGRRIACPVLVIWAGRSDLESLYPDILGIWRTWAPDVRGHAIDSGHHLAEERARSAGPRPARLPRAAQDAWIRMRSVAAARPAPVRACGRPRRTAG